MLKIDPVKRLAASDALKHQWFKNNKVEYSLESTFVEDSFNNFMRFSPDQKFQQATIAYMVHHLTDAEDNKNLRIMFENFDSNLDGKLSHSEIVDGFKKNISLMQTFNEKEFWKKIKKIDQDKSGFIEYEEFVRACIDKSNLLSEVNLKKTFELFDKDGSGSITPSEIKSILGLSAKYSDKVWSEIINQIEHNNDYEVTFDEFKKMMLKLISNSNDF
jgi:calcium-dependent protein kinase